METAGDIQRLVETVGTSRDLNRDCVDQWRPTETVGTSGDHWRPTETVGTSGD